MKKKQMFGHLWKQKTGNCVYWTGWDGFFQCKRCLALMKAYNKSHTDPYVYEWLQDIYGKRIPKKKWTICSADKEVGEQ